MTAAWARLDDRDELIDSLGQDALQNRSASDTELIGRAYDAWGIDCVDHVRGDFSFGVYDPTNRSVLLARDPLGVRPLLFHISSDRLVASTTLATFHRVADLTLTPREEWIARYMIEQSTSHRATPYDEVSKLQGGHRLVVHLDDCDVEPEPRQWFHFVDDAPDASRRDDRWVDRYRTELVAAVERRLDTDAPMGVESSGGIDSSTCVGLAARASRGSAVHALGYAAFEDEAVLITETSEFVGIDNTVLLAERPVREVGNDVDRALTVLGQPAEHALATGHTALYVAAQERRIRALLSGFGGDECVTSPAPLLRHELFDQRRFVLLWKEMAGPWWQRPVRYVHIARRLRRRSNARGRATILAEQRIGLSVLRPAVTDRFDLENKYFDHAAAHHRDRTINEYVLNQRFGQPFIATRLAECSAIANSYGIEYRWPLLDPRLAQQYLSTPSIEKRHRGMGRFLHRRAIEGVVPASVQWRPSKAMGARLDDVESELPVDVDLENLHPLLEPVVDTVKLERLLNDASGQTAWIARRQARRLGALDQWLRRFHPVS